MVIGFRPNTSDYLLADSGPDDVALVEAGERYTYRQLRSAAERLAAELAALELPSGSRVNATDFRCFSPPELLLLSCSMRALKSVSG
jgi:non-ribosomal peptide synthetase component F